jgi:hypothetical protein
VVLAPQGALYLFTVRDRADRGGRQIAGKCEENSSAPIWAAHNCCSAMEFTRGVEAAKLGAVRYALTDA